MAFQNTNPFYGSSSGGIPAGGGQQRLALDNLIRRELKVGDPNDPKQIAEALLNRFKDDPRANAINQEARGLPFLQAGSAITTQPASTSSSNELKQAMDDVDRDLEELTTNSLLKDVTPELQGWADAIRGSIAEGTTAARFALDPRQRDKVFGIRRNLQDYARAARMVGAVTPAMNQTYRSFAKSLDEAAGVLLVMMGEALAEAGFNGGRYLLSVPYTELQVRRDTVISALRGLVGSNFITYGQEDFPYGLHGYRELLDYLETHGQGDLRTMLVESELSRSMDMLIQRAAHGTPEGLRALGATAAIELRKYRRMLRAANAAVFNPLSPPLTAYLKSLQLFIDAFSAGGGYRLISIARPSVLLYGLYDVATSPDTDVLNDLVRQRGRLAGKLDCFLSCECGSAEVVYQVILDKLLYDTDRAIDLYAMSSDESGEAEDRAMSYGYLTSYVLGTLQPEKSVYSRGIPQSLNDATNFYKPKATELLAGIKQVLDEVRKSLLGGYYSTTNQTFTVPTLNLIELCDRELCAQYEAEESLKELVATLAPKCSLALTESDKGFFGKKGLNATLVQETRKFLRNPNNETSNPNPGEVTSCEDIGVPMPGTSTESNDKQLKQDNLNLRLAAQAMKIQALESLGDSQNSQAESNKLIVELDNAINNFYEIINNQYFQHSAKTNGLEIASKAIYDLSGEKKRPLEHTNEEQKMVEIYRLVKTLLDVAKANDTNERMEAINKFEHFTKINVSLVEDLHLSDTFSKIMETFNNIPIQSGEAQTKSLMSLKERCIDLVSVIGLGIKR